MDNMHSASTGKNILNVCALMAAACLPSSATCSAQEEQVYTDIAGAAIVRSLPDNEGIYSANIQLKQFIDGTNVIRQIRNDGVQILIPTAPLGDLKDVLQGKYTELAEQLYGTRPEIKADFLDFINAVLNSEAVANNLQEEEVVTIVRLVDLAQSEQASPEMKNRLVDLIFSELELQNLNIPQIVPTVAKTGEIGDSVKINYRNLCKGFSHAVTEYFSNDEEVRQKAEKFIEHSRTLGFTNWEFNTLMIGGLLLVGFGCYAYFASTQKNTIA